LDGFDSQYIIGFVHDKKQSNIENKCRGAFIFILERNELFSITTIT
jgi:hypothetical protein